MKNLFFLAAVSSLALSTVSCKSKKDATASGGNSSTATSAAPASEPQPITYRLIVSFISKGAGTDGPKRTAFTEYVAANAKKPAYKEVRWGREGEGDYCFTLSEFKSEADKVSFIDGVKKIAAESDLIVVSENAQCQHKGR
jgi:hypothetical protein